MVIYIDNFINLFSEGVDKDALEKIKQENDKVEIKLNFREILNEEETIKVVQATNNLRKEGIECKFSEFTVEEALNASRKINGWVKEIKDARVNGKELSPFEKYMYAYDIASQFTYKMEDEGESEDISRNLIHVLNGDKIVCVGFANILESILNGLGIVCSDTSLYPTNEGRKNGKKPHSACLVYLDDPKYRIKGNFFSDPTFGSPKHNEKLGQNTKYSILDLKTAREFYKSKGELVFVNIEKDKLSAFENVYGDIVSLKEHSDRKNNHIEFLKNYNEKIKNNTQEFLKIFEEAVDKVAQQPLDEELLPSDNVQSLVDSTFDKLLHNFQRPFWKVRLLTSAENNIKKLLKMDVSKEEIVEKINQEINDFNELDEHQQVFKVFGFDYLNEKTIKDEDVEKYNALKEEVLTTDLENFGFRSEERIDKIEAAMEQVAYSRGKNFDEAVGYIIAREFAYDEEEEKIIVDVFSKNRSLTYDELLKKVNEEIELRNSEDFDELE